MKATREDARRAEEALRAARQYLQLPQDKIALAVHLDTLAQFLKACRQRLPSETKPRRPRAKRKIAGMVLLLLLPAAAAQADFIISYDAQQRPTKVRGIPHPATPSTIYNVYIDWDLTYDQVYRERWLSRYIGGFSSLYPQALDALEADGFIPADLQLWEGHAIDLDYRGDPQFSATPYRVIGGEWTKQDRLRGLDIDTVYPGVGIMTKTPEPATWLLMFVGLVGLLWVHWKRLPWVKDGYGTRLGHRQPPLPPLPADLEGGHDAPRRRDRLPVP